MIGHTNSSEAKLSGKSPWTDAVQTFLHESLCKRKYHPKPHDSVLTSQFALDSQLKLLAIIVLKFNHV